MIFVLCCVGFSIFSIVAFSIGHNESKEDEKKKEKKKDCVLSVWGGVGFWLDANPWCGKSCVARFKRCRCRSLDDP